MGPRFRRVGTTGITSCTASLPPGVRQWTGGGSGVSRECVSLLETPCLVIVAPPPAQSRAQCSPIITIRFSLSPSLHLYLSLSKNLFPPLHEYLALFLPSLSTLALSLYSSLFLFQSPVSRGSQSDVIYCILADQ